MTARPIIMSGPMVRALKVGRKTQTRRVLKRLRRFGLVSEFGRSDTVGYDWHFRDREKRWHDLRHADLLRCLPYAVGDLLWVREAWAKVGDEPDDIHACPDLRVHVYYRADSVAPEHQHWRSPIHMPRWASRITLAVTNVRVERLQDISEADARAEGVTRAPGGWWSGAERQAGATPRSAYAVLWGSLHGPGAWQADPWVAAVSFETHFANVDTIRSTP